MSPLTITLILFLFYSAISFYFSTNSELSIYPTLKILSSLFLVLALLFYLKNIETLKRAYSIIFTFAGILATAGIVEQFFLLLIPLHAEEIPELRGLFTNRNLFSGYLVIHVPIGIYLYFKASTVFEKNLMGFALISILISMGLTGSRAGCVIVIFQIIIIILYLLKNKEKRKSQINWVWSTSFCFNIFYYIKIFFRTKYHTPFNRKSSLGKT